MSGNNTSGSQNLKETSPKIRKHHKALREIVERQKLRRVVQVELKSRQEVSSNTETLTQSASQKLTVSCGSQTCSIQTEIHRERRVVTEDSTPLMSVATVECEAKEQVLVTSDSFIADGFSVPPFSPGRSQSLYGNRTRLGNSPQTPRTPPRSPRTPQTPTNSQTAPRSPQKPRTPRSATASPHTPKKQSSPQRGKSSPLRQINSGFIPEPAARNSEANKPPRFPKKNIRNDEIQVKPLVNTYHVITEKPRIRARKGAPKDLQSSNVKEIFSWAQNTETKDRDEREPTPERVGLIRQSPIASVETPKFIAIPQPTLPRSSVHGFARHVPVEIIRDQDLPDQLSDEEYRTVRPTRKCAAKPLVNTSFRPSPPKRSKDAIMMFVPISGDSSVPEKAQLLVPRPPRIQTYDRSEVLAFMKRKRLERRQQKRNGKTQHYDDQSPSKSFLLAESPQEVCDEFSKIFDFEEIEQLKPAFRRVVDGAQQLSELVTQLKDPRSDQLETLLAKFENRISAEIRECGVNELSFETKVNKYASNKLSVDQRLEDTTHRLNSFLVNLGLRESCSALIPRISENSGTNRL